LPRWLLEWLRGVHRNKPLWDEQRHAIARPVEQAIQQRTASMHQFSHRDEA